jgi:hypothetical protein
MKLRGLKWSMASLALSAGKTFVLKVDDETVIGYHGFHTQKRANQLSVALTFYDVSSAVLLKFINKCLP